MCVCFVSDRQLQTEAGNKRDRMQRKRKGSWLSIPPSKELPKQNKNAPLRQYVNIGISSYKPVMVFLCVPYNTGWQGWTGTPLEQLLSLQLAPEQKHPVPWWWCLPRTGPRRHPRWLPQAEGKKWTQSVHRFTRFLTRKSNIMLPPFCFVDILV